MNVTSDGKNLTIVVPISTELKPSSSGKTLLVATETARESGVEINGKQVTVTVNAYIKK